VPPDGGLPRLSLMMAKQRAGNAGSTAIAAHRFTDDTNSPNLGAITSIPGTEYAASPGGNRRFLRFGTGIPAPGATSARVELSANSYYASYQRCARWAVPTTPVATATGGSGSVVLREVRPGSKIIVIALMTNTDSGSWVVTDGSASPPFVTLVDAQNDPSGNGDCRVEVIELNAPAGGTFILSRAGASGLSAVAIAAA